MFNFPNFFTLLRIIFGGIFIYVLFWPDLWLENPIWRYVSLVFIYLFAALTDYFDGYFARKLLVKTSFGAFFDPLADKGFILSIYIAFLFVEPLNLFVFPVVLIALREVAVTFLRILSRRQGSEMVTEAHGKFKTFFQFFCQGVIIFLLVFYQVLCQEESFFAFLSEQNLYYANVPLISMPFRVIADYLINQNVSFFSIFVLQWTPNLLVLISMIFTLQSGIRYFFSNSHIFKN